MKRNHILIIGATLLVVVAYIMARLLSGSSLSLTQDESLSNHIETRTGSCIECHGGVVGMAPGHSEIECSICHGGNSLSDNLDSAHAGMISIPGNFADMDQTCGLCHPAAVENIRSSIMTTNSGIINVDKYIFGETDSPDGYAHMANLGHSAGDEHLRDLCANCHIGAEKKEFGPVSELTRGGGCNACHLNYSSQGLAQHALFKTDSILPTIHPSLDLNVSDDHCFGCHSRSGRISTNYQGYHETLYKAEDVSGKSGYRVLEDDRVFQYIAEDLHHAKGLSCTDCHAYADVMGDGNLYQHEEDAVKIACEDCHTTNFDQTTVYDSLDFVNKRIMAMRNYEHIDQPLVVTEKDAAPLLNIVLDGDEAELLSKRDGKSHPLLAPSESCSREEGHNTLTCSSCHTSWAPQCIGCHVSYDAAAQGYDLLDKTNKKGAWIEYAGEFLAGEPTLGVREETNERKVEVAIPGMIMSWDKRSHSEGQATGDEDFYRLFAPAKPHTTAAAGRSCPSCHNNPVALGYGRGSLEYTIDNGLGRWAFESEYAKLDQDGLPADAWTGFLQERTGIVSTRTNFRPFNIAEQQKILRVGACLTCHEAQSTVMRSSLHENFDELLLKKSPECIIPVF